MKKRLLERRGRLRAGKVTSDSLGDSPSEFDGGTILERGRDGDDSD